MWFPGLFLVFRFRSVTDRISSDGFIDVKSFPYRATNIALEIAPNQVTSIPDGTVLEGTFRTAKLKLVQAWIEIHQEELMTDWNRAVSGQSVFKIEPLR